MKTVEKRIWVSRNKIAERFLNNLPDPWIWNEYRAERLIDVLEYEEIDIEDEQMRSDANSGFDLRQRAEHNWRAEVMDVKLSNSKKVKLAIDHCWELDPLRARKMLKDDKDALKYFDENLA